MCSLDTRLYGGCPHRNINPYARREVGGKPHIIHSYPGGLSANELILSYFVFRKDLQYNKSNEKEHIYLLMIYIYKLYSLVISCFWPQEWNKLNSETIPCIYLGGIAPPITVTLCSDPKELAQCLFITPQLPIWKEGHCTEFIVIHL